METVALSAIAASVTVLLWSLLAKAKGRIAAAVSQRREMEALLRDVRELLDLLKEEGNGQSQGR